MFNLSFLGDILSIGIGVGICYCFYYHCGGGTTLCKPRSNCVEKVGKEKVKDLYHDQYMGDV